MSDNLDQHKTFSRRVAMLVGGKAALLSVIGWRMYDLQVSEGKKYAVLADENRINTRVILPPRGRILDRFGAPLAANKEHYQAIIVAEQTSNVRATLRHLAKILPLTDDDIVQVLRRIRRQRRFVPVTVAKGITWDQVAQIEVNSPHLPGIYVEDGLTRIYPSGTGAAHLVGFVGAVSSEDKQADKDPLLSQPDFKVGRSGIERYYDRRLRGSGGRRQVEVNAAGRVQRELGRDDATPGTDLRLSIDSGLQRYASARLLRERSAAAVVLDILTGDVLALAMTPSYDPNIFVRGITAATWRAMRADERAPLSNKAIAGNYAPGSTFKMLVALAGLEAGVITPSTYFSCGGAMNLGSARFHCWRRGGHGAMNVHNAIKQSCDVFFYETALKLGVDKIGAMARKLGLGTPTGIDLPGESGGLIPSSEWKRKYFRANWYPGETAITGIGQGYVLATPLQLAVMTARLVSGKAVDPRLLVGSDDLAKGESPPIPTFPSLGIKPENLAVIHRAMNAVVNEPGGTAGGSRIHDPKMAMAGKTGTSQVRRITKAERARGVIRNEDLPWNRRDHALFVAFAPVGNPRYAAAVLVEHGGGGSRAAAPIARDIMLEAQVRGSAARKLKALPGERGVSKTDRKQN